MLSSGFFVFVLFLLVGLVCLFWDFGFGFAFFAFGSWEQGLCLPLESDGSGHHVSIVF